MRYLSRASSVILCLLAACPTARANTITVNGLGDDANASDAVCTLREAINNANANATDTTGGDCATGDNNTGSDTIVFSVTGTIAVSTQLPNLTSRTFINGLGSPGSPTATCPAWPPSLTVSLSPSATVNFGLRIQGSSSIVRGLVIGGFGISGISIGPGTGNRVQCSFIGTNAAGTAAAGNGTGISIGSSANFIGTDGDGVNDLNEGNLVSGSSGFGINVAESTTLNRIAGNRIGTDAAGSSVIGNLVGVQIGGAGNIVGTNGDGVSDGAEGNLIGGGSIGVSLSGPGAVSNRVSGNRIGVNVTGTALGIGSSGVAIQGGATSNLVGTDGNGTSDTLETNIIGNTSDGVFLSEASGNHISRNFIGNDGATSSNMGNSGAGVRIQDGGFLNIVGTDGNGTGDSVERNFIGDNAVAGVVISGSNSNRVSGNLIGTDSPGTQGIPNGGSGVLIQSASLNIVGTNGDGTGDADEANVIGFNARYGVEIEGFSATDNRVAGNFIGRSRNQAVAIGNALGGVRLQNNTASNVIGTNGDGTSDALEGNLIASNAMHGVSVATAQNRIAGNFIGTNSLGTPMGNGAAGVFLDSEANGNVIGAASGAVEGNVIGANGTCGVDVTGSASGNVIAGNSIGRSGAVAVGNTLCGVRFIDAPSSNRVGTDANGSNDAIEPNLIASNGGPGVLIDGGSPNAVRGNVMESNGGLGIDIDLEGPGVTPNDAGDADAGPNGVQNFPVIEDVVAAGGMLEVSGSLNSTPLTPFALEFFANESCDPSLFGEGAALLGNLTTDATDANGDVDFLFSFSASPEELADPPPITATATGAEGTSEFSACFRKDLLFADGFEGGAAAR